MIFLTRSHANTWLHTVGNSLGWKGHRVRCSSEMFCYGRGICTAFPL